MEKQEIVLHFFHPHPLRWIANPIEEAGSYWNSWCYGCWRNFIPGEAAYGCSLNCGSRRCLHEECAEIAREVRHPAHHSSHALTPAYVNEVGADHTPCVVCKEHDRYGLGYICKEGCEFLIHMRCAGGLVLADEEHPQHELRHLRRPSSFKCDACATDELQSSYACNICDYWIHQGCISLPTTKHFHHQHEHSLSLAFHPPFEYIKFEYTCDVCSGALRLRNWIYHCEFCRYIVHINCATNNASYRIKNENAEDIDEVILKAPINNMYEEIIRPFVERERGVISISRESEITNEYIFENHNHPLSFITFSSLSTSYDRSKEEGDDDKDADKNERSELICGGCTLPIEEKLSNHDEGYMCCRECKYFLHLACFNLPPFLSSHPLHHHILRLQSSHKLTNWSRCDFCNLWTNGLFYSCKECDFIIDIKCASMPDIIKHADHTQHRHYLKRVTLNHQITSFCVACYSTICGYEKYYKCNSCRFSLCYGCASLPARNKHRLDKHWLPLTYDASVNRPGDFYCSNCEEQMNPKSWMYHCRNCDQSFHPKCFPGTSGEYRNINFWQKHYHVRCHPHHFLKFQIISKMTFCNICHMEAFDYPGYQCTSCNFVMCFFHDAIEVNQPMN